MDKLTNDSLASLRIRSIPPTLYRRKAVNADAGILCNSNPYENKYCVNALRIEALVFFWNPQVMPKPVLIYGICGEGLGHAARAYALIERLERDAEVHIVTSGDAFDFFSGLGYPHLHLVGVIRFVKKGQSFNLAASTRHCFKFVARGTTHLRQSSEILDTIRTDVSP